jgi:hypothetical protein
MRNCTMSKYATLSKILDQIRTEGVAAGFPSYGSDPDNPEWTNQARSRAYIHLFLKVRFGVLDFREREVYVTDGTQDGGVDGYFIDRDSRTIIFLQSKFRTTEKNFRSKQITLDEIASMDIGRMTAGESSDEKGNEYNGKIKGLIRSITEIEDIGRYRYKITIIANLHNVSDTTLRNLTGGFPIEILDAERCYSELVFPVLSGTYFQKEELSILLDLSNKNAGSKITYEVSTKFGSCDITVLFVPTLEIAKIMYKYKNSILKYNPRSYLEFDGAPVNDSIRSTIISGTTNEFALLNNGITMISDETNINEKIGQKNKAQLFVKNPQIINGGQTAYTLSRIYQENFAEAERTFAGKEVLLKVITLALPTQDETAGKDSATLIDRISTATNRQTAVTNSDRHSNDEGFASLQKSVFDQVGVLFERKRGEFGDGVREGYLDQDQIVDRNTFARIFFAANGRLGEGSSKRAFLQIKHPGQAAVDQGEISRFYCGYRYHVASGWPALNRHNKGRVARIFAFTLDHLSDLSDEEQQNSLLERVRAFELKWGEFVRMRNAGEFSQNRHFGNLKGDILKYFGSSTDTKKSAVITKDEPKEIASASSDTPL